jgi:hypothetical protein
VIIKIKNKTKNGIAVSTWKNLNSLSVMTSALNESWLYWTVLFSTTACIGGLLVFWGLVKEKLADREIFPNIEDFRRSKNMREAGWRILMVGIGFEIITAFASTWRGEAEIRQTRINEAKIDPRNANISDMAATAVFTVKGYNFNALTNWDKRWVARMALCNGDRTKFPSSSAIFNPSEFDVLDAESFVCDDPVAIFSAKEGIFVGTPCGLRFRSFNFRALNNLEKSAKSIDNVSLLRMDLNFLPAGSEISGGLVTLTVNDSIKKRFMILPQIDTNEPDGRVGHPYIVFATNFDQTIMNRITGKNK